MGNYTRVSLPGCRRADGKLMFGVIKAFLVTIPATPCQLLGDIANLNSNGLTLLVLLSVSACPAACCEL